MKKYLFLSLIFLSCFSAKAQPWSTQYAYVLGLTNSSITSSTVPITKTVDGAVRDTTLGLMNYLYSLIISPGNLQGVTALGNTTTYGVKAQPVTSITGAGIDWILLNPNGTLQYLWDNGVGTDYLTSLSIAPQTSGNSWQLPNESGVLVTHTTATGITIGSTGAGANNTQVEPNGIAITDGGNEWGIWTPGANGMSMGFKDGTNPYMGTVQAGNSNLTANRTYTWPDETGTLALKQDVANISNAALTWNGSYIQNVAGYNLQLKGIRTSILSDINGFPFFYSDTVLNLSGRASVALIHNSGQDEAIVGDSAAAISLQANPGGIEVEISTGINFTPALQIDDTQHILLTNLPTDYSPLSDSVVMENTTTHFLNRVPYKYLVTPLDSSATSFTTNVTYNWDVYGGATISAQAGALNFVNPTGTLRNKQRFSIAINDNGTPHALTWGTAYVAASNVPLPSTTATGFINYIQLVYSTIDSKIHITGYTY